MSTGLMANQRSERVFSGSVVLFAGQAVVYGSSFVRNMILARLLTKADFGISATFSLVILLLDISTKMGISRFVIQDKEGDKAEFIAAAHLMACLVAILSSLVMAAAAWPLADMFGLEGHRWAMFTIAAIPIIDGLGHLDVRRFERDLRFGPSTLVEAVPHLVVTTMAWPLAYWIGDYRAMLVLLIGRSVLTCGASHWLAERPYRWKAHRKYLGRMVKFGWPLVVAGILMFVALRGDQFLVATYYTMEDLGSFAAASALAMIPTFFFGRVFNTLMLPLMAKVQSNKEEFTRQYHLALSVAGTFAAASSVGMIVGAEALISLVYGPKYSGSGMILGWLAAANAFRILRNGPSLAALAKGDSHNQMIGNMCRSLAILPAAGLAMAGQPVWMIAATGVLGESFACGAALLRLGRRDGIRLKASLILVGLVTLATSLSVPGSLWVGNWNGSLALLAAVLASILAAAFLIIASPNLRSEAARFPLRRGI